MFKFAFLLVIGVSATLAGKLPKGLVPRLDGRIVGGVPTTVETFPHQVSMRYYGYHRCGGTVFKPNIIISAAHCTDAIPPSNLAIVAGETYQSGQKGVRRQVKSKVEHEMFDPWEYLNDVVILWLEQGFELGPTIRPLALASPNEKLKAGTMVWVSGWGTLMPGGSSPDQLQVVYVPIVSNEDCAKAYDGINAVTDSMMCAGEKVGGKDACQGDSGGPLIVNDKLYGIVSWGVSCALADYPGVYANVGNLRNWIDSKLSSN